MRSLPFENTNTVSATKKGEAGTALRPWACLTVADRNHEKVSIFSPLNIEGEPSNPGLSACGQ